MREYRYTTPHGIEVTRTVSQGQLPQGPEAPAARSGPAPWDLSFLGIRVSRAVLALGHRLHLPAARDRLLRPPRGVPPAQRARRRSLPRCSHPVLAGHPHWEEFGFEGGALAGRLKPLPALFPEEERSKQPSVFSILRALIEEFRGEEDSRLALVGAFGYDLLFQFEPIEKKLPRDGHKDLHLFLCDDIWFMDRKKEQIERYQYDFERGGVSTARPAARRRAIAPPPQRAARPDRLRPHAGRVHGQRGDRARGHAPRRLLRGGAAPDLPHAVLRQGLRAVRARAATPAPAPTSSCCSSATSNWWARRRRCSCGWKASASRPAPFPAPRSAPAIRCATPTTSASCSKSTKEESELTMCTDVDRNDKSRVCEPGTVQGDRAAADRIATPACSTRWIT